MYKARRHLDKKVCLTYVTQYTYPYLTYCIQAWRCAAKSHLQYLFINKIKIVRIMTFAPYLVHFAHIFSTFHTH